MMNRLPAQLQCLGRERSDPASEVLGSSGGGRLSGAPAPSGGWPVSDVVQVCVAPSRWWLIGVRWRTRGAMAAAASRRIAR